MYLVNSYLKEVSKCRETLGVSDKIERVRVPVCKAQGLRSRESPEQSVVHKEWRESNCDTPRRRAPTPPSPWSVFQDPSSKEATCKRH